MDRHRREAGRAPARVAQRWIEELGDTRALDVTTGRLERLCAEWTKSGLAGASINRRLAALRNAFKLAKILVDPAVLDFSDVWMPEAAPREQYVPVDVFYRIHKELPEWLQDFSELAFFSSIRRGQLASTAWENVDPKTWVIRWDARQTKQRKVHRLALAGRPLAIVQRRWHERRPGCEYVFHRDGERLTPDVIHRPPFCFTTG